MNFLALSTLLLLPATTPANTEPAGFESPERKPLDHYLQQASRNPFGPPSQKNVPVTQPNFAKNLYINGIITIDEEQTVYIADKNDKTVFSLSTGGAHDGIELVEVEMSPTLGATSVIIRKDSQTAKLTYDQAQMFAGTQPQNESKPAPPNPGARPPGRPPRQAEGDNNRGRSTILRRQRPVRIIRAPSKK